MRINEAANGARIKRIGYFIIDGTGGRRLYMKRESEKW
jgi:hypothetical protein